MRLPRMTIQGVSRGSDLVCAVNLCKVLIFSKCKSCPASG
jgi:hypothetical protein